jgi:16S rRNA processing protein RimM
LPLKKNPNRFVCVGFVQKPHALKGELKACFHYSFTGKKLKTVYIGNENPLPFSVEHILPSAKNVFFLKTAECNDRNASEELAGEKIHVAEDDFTKYFEPDEAAGLIGFKAAAGENLIGTIEDVFKLPHQHLAQVLYKGKEVLIPLNDSTIIQVDKRKKIIRLNIPDGLLDID